MDSIKKTARLAGLIYLLVIIFGVFAEVGVRSQLILAGDPTATAGKITASQSLFRLGFVSDLVMMTLYFLLAYALYLVFQPVKKNLALLFLLLTLASVAIMSINMLHQFAALLLLNGAGYLQTFSAEQLQALALLFTELHRYGYFISQIFFGLWLLPLGYAGFKSGYFPKVLGILVMLASLGHLIQFFQVFLLPDYKAISYPGLAVATIGEFSLCFWLLIKGVKVPEIKS